MDIDNNRLFIKNLFSGYLSGLISITICAPLDFVRTRMNIGHINLFNFRHAATDILINTYKKHGYLGYYQGFSGSLLGVPLFHSIYFSIYYNIKQYNLKKIQKAKESNKILIDIKSSIISGCISQILTNPIWVARIRMQVNEMHSINNNHSIFSEIKNIYIHEGVKGMMKGTYASIIGVSHVTIYMPLYDYLTRKTIVYIDGSFLSITLISSISKFIASLLTYPHVTIRSRLQDYRGLKHQDEIYNIKDEKINCKNKLKTRTLINYIYNKEGIKGFYLGFKIDLIKMIPTNIILMYILENIKKKLNILQH